MSNEKWPRNLFIVVTVICVAVFLFLTVDTLKQVQARSPELTEKVVAGKRLWQKNNCINCHTILGNGAYFAPDLTKVAQKRGEKWLVEFLKDPVAVMPGTVMKNIAMSEQEADEMAAFLEWVSKVDTNGWPPEPLGLGDSEDSSSGESVFQQAGCVSCHTTNGDGGTFGPDLSNVASERNNSWLKKYISNPKQINEQAKMPDSSLSGEELDAVVDYLNNLK